MLNSEGTLAAPLYLDVSLTISFAVRSAFSSIHRLGYIRCNTHMQKHPKKSSISTTCNRSSNENEAVPQVPKKRSKLEPLFLQEQR